MTFCGSYQIPTELRAKLHIQLCSESNYCENYRKISLTPTLSMNLVQVW